MRKYKLNECYFKEIDTENKAYWLGFITADGCVVGNKLTIRLKRSDKQHIMKFLHDIQSEHLIKEDEKTIRGKTFPSCYTSVYSKKMVENLKDLEVLPNKSTREIPWSGPKHLLRHYFRGLVDGDGCISKFKTKSSPNHQWYVGLCGSPKILDSFSSCVKDQIGYDSQAIRRQGRIFTLCYRGVNKPQAVAKFLYSDCSVFLERKKLLAEELSGISCLSRRQLSVDEIVSLYSKFGTWKDVAGHLNMDIKTFYRRRKELRLI